MTFQSEAQAILNRYFEINYAVLQLCKSLEAIMKNMYTDW